MRGSLVVLGVVLAAVAVGCVPPPVYAVQRSARVPRPAAPLRTGEPLAGPIELSVGATAGSTARLVDDHAAIEVPTQQARGELRVRIGRGEITPFYEQAVESSIAALDATQAPVERGAPTAIGLATRYSFATGVTGLSIGTGLEVMSWSIPYVEYRSCVQYCEENGVSGTQMYGGTETIGTVALGLTPTYRDGRFAVFGGAYTRRHPTITRKGLEVGPEVDRDISAGNFNMIVHAGVEVRASVVSLLATVQQDLTRDPVRYGPSIGFALAVHVPEPEPRAPRAPQPVILDDGDLPDDPW